MCVILNSACVCKHNLPSVLIIFRPNTGNFTIRRINEPLSIQRKAFYMRENDLFKFFKGLLIILEILGKLTTCSIFLLGLAIRWMGPSISSRESLHVLLIHKNWASFGIKLACHNVTLFM
ncbi:hypothetical protein KP509_31G049100 [Ceratopteris richardii]|uniref:Uncharacterized protein n=1 Tax=Ceratopteris richardii TaxID=49495 RepID=A0A8T2QY28_CERRI|nr:hypothetical protein KP509_31G049100 [Ceratopteris richardii]